MTMTMMMILAMMTIMMMMIDDDDDDADGGDNDDDDNDNDIDGCQLTRWERRRSRAWMLHDVDLTELTHSRKPLWRFNISQTFNLGLESRWQSSRCFSKPEIVYLELVNSWIKKGKPSSLKIIKGQIFPSSNSLWKEVQAKQSALLKNALQFFLLLKSIDNLVIGRWYSTTVNHPPSFQLFTDILLRNKRSCPWLSVYTMSVAGFTMEVSGFPLQGFPLQDIRAIPAYGTMLPLQGHHAPWPPRISLNSPPDPTTMAWCVRPSPVQGCHSPQTAPHLHLPILPRNLGGDQGYDNCPKINFSLGFQASHLCRCGSNRSPRCWNQCCSIWLKFEPKLLWANHLLWFFL